MNRSGFVFFISCLLISYVVSETQKPEEPIVGEVVGIDLGTTYSCVGIYRGGKVEIIPNDQGNRITPSWVAFTDNERLIGDGAKNQAALNPKNTIFNVKRIIGRMWNDPEVQRDIKLFPFRVVNKNDRPFISVEIKGEVKTFAPEEISAMVLQKMKEIAETYLNKNVTHAVITCPAYFNDAQRAATKDAGIIAGLQVLRVINEPTAAALAYGLDKSGEKNILVFDLGGGTFDVSLLTIDMDPTTGSGVFDVLATNGDTHLGGEDFDQRLLDHCLDAFQKKTGKNPRGENRAVSKLKREVERAKRVLSSDLSVKIEVENFFDGEEFSETISRAKFEELNLDLFKKTIRPVEKVLEDASLKKDDVDEVILVGGSTRIPRVQQLLSEFFGGKELNKGVNPDEAVAYGAAVQAGIIASKNQSAEYIILDVNPLSLGVSDDDGLMEVLIPRNTHIPTSRESTFTTVKDNQRSILFEIYEGEREIAAKNHYLDEFELSGIPPAKKGVPEIVVTFTIDVNGILSASAEDKATGNKRQITMKQKGRPSSEIDKMVEDAEKFKEEDRKARERVAARDEFENYIYGVEGALTPDVEKLLSTENLNKIKKLIKKANSWLDQHRGDTKEKIEQKHEEIEDAITPLMAAIYKQHAKERRGDDGADSQSTQSDDDDKGGKDEEEVKLKPKEEL